MRVLVAHNAYQQRGGEDHVVDDEVALLRAHGHEVELLLASNDDIADMGRLDLLRRTLWSSPAAQAVRERCAAFRPDVMHVHNSFPLLSPAIHWAAQAAGVPVVQTLHNFRLICPQAMLLREGKICKDCVGHLPWRGVVRGCYRGSVPQSMVLGGMLGLHQALGTWRRRVNRFIALNETCRREFVAGGLPPDRIRVKQNFVDLPAPPETARSGGLAVGRLAPEKGWLAIKAAAAASGTSIDVIGHGPLEPELRGQTGLNLLGALPSSEVYERMRHAAFQVVASICLEGGPRTLIEGMACGLPAICSDLDPMAEIVEGGVTGLFFETGNARHLAERLAWASSHPAELREMGRNARRVYEARYTALGNQRQLLAIYEEAVEEGALHD